MRIACLSIPPTNRPWRNKREMSIVNLSLYDTLCYSIYICYFITTLDTVLRHLFGAVVTSEDVTRQKPAPDIFLEAARGLGVAPGACLAYEDAELGLQAIRAAGMEAVDVRVTGQSTCTL